MAGSVARVRVRICILALGSSALWGCGGGGGDGPPPNKPPVAIAGPDQFVVEGATVELDASGSTDADGSIRSYAWAQSSGVSVDLTGADSAHASFEPPLTDEPYELVFELSVTDDDGATATSFTTVTIIPSEAPSVSAGIDQDVVEADDVSLDATISDVDGSIVSIEWHQIAGPDVTLSDAAAEAPTFVAPIVDADTNIEFEVVAVDSTNDSSSDSVLIVVHPNQPPSVAAGIDQETVETMQVSLDATISDVDNAVVSINWQQVAGPEVVLSDSTIEDPGFSAPRVGELTDLEFRVTAVDTLGDSSTDTVLVVVYPNEPPVLSVEFPCPDCRFYGNAISLTGRVDNGADAAFVQEIDQVTSVVVDAGAGPVNALVQTDNLWIAQNVPVPASLDVTITVTATDNFSETTDHVQALDNRPTLSLVRMTVDPAATGGYYIFEDTGFTQRLLRFDVSTGAFERIYEDREQLHTFLGQVMAIFPDPTDSRILVSDFPHGITAIDVVTGEVQFVSGVERGTGPTISEWGVVALDANNDRLIAYDGATEGLYEVDIVSGNRVLIVDNSSTVSGQAFVEPTSITVDESGDFAYLVEPFDEYLQVNLTTGFRTLLPRSGASSGPLSSIEFDPISATLYSTDYFNDQIMAVDPATGNRTVLSASPSDPSLQLGDAQQVISDPFLDFLIVNDFGDWEPDTDQFVAVDKQTGERSVIYKDSVGNGPSIKGPVSIDIDPVSNVLYAGSEAESAIFGIDIDSGDRRVIASDVVGAGGPMGTIVAVGYDRVLDRLLFVDRQNSRLGAVDIATGNRAILADGLIGTGDLLIDPDALALDADAQIAFVADPGQDAIVSVDLATGARTMVSGPGTSGIEFSEVGGMSLDLSNNQLVLTENGTAAYDELKVVAVDLATGERRIISDWKTGSGAFWTLVLGLDLVADDNRIIVSSGVSIVLVDLETGDRSFIATQSIGSGETLLNLRQVKYDSSNQVIYSWSTNFDALFAISILTGDRVIVSK